LEVKKVDVFGIRIEMLYDV